MLHEFLKAHRGELIDRCRAKVEKRRTPRATPEELEHGVPLFLDQLTEMLESGERISQRAARPGGPDAAAEARMDSSAARHGEELLRHEFSIDHVVHDYGDVCQAITELASELDAPITVEEFGHLNIRLDNAIAGAVTEFARGARDHDQSEETLATNERLGVLAHEMRNLLNTTILAISAIKAGSVGFGGATAGALDRSLTGMRMLIDRTLAEVRLGAGAASAETIELARFIQNVRIGAGLEASQRGCVLTVLPVEPGIHIEADRHILGSALVNLLQNAFKFTRPGTEVRLRAHAANGRVLMEVEDECGGLPAGLEQRVFAPFVKGGADRSGLGLGLTISRTAVEALGGKLYVRNIPGKGCVFTIDLPRRE